MTQSNPYETLARSRKAAAIAKAIAESLPSGQALPAELPAHTWTLAAKAANVPNPSDETKQRVMAILAAWYSFSAAKVSFRYAVCDYVAERVEHSEAVRAEAALDQAVWSLVETAQGKESR